VHLPAGRSNLRIFAKRVKYRRALGSWKKSSADIDDHFLISSLIDGELICTKRNAHELTVITRELK
jgi:hypothetical protein